MSKKNPFEINIRGIFDDTDALKILTDNEGLVSIEGQAILRPQAEKRLLL